MLSGLGFKVCLGFFGDLGFEVSWFRVQGFRVEGWIEDEGLLEARVQGFSSYNYRLFTGVYRFRDAVVVQRLGF